MPRGKELEQLPMSNIAPGAGDDQSKYNRVNLNGYSQQERTKPSDVSKKNNN